MRGFASFAVGDQPPQVRGLSQPVPVAADRVMDGGGDLADDGQPTGCDRHPAALRAVEADVREEEEVRPEPSRETGHHRLVSRASRRERIPPLLQPAYAVTIVLRGVSRWFCMMACCVTNPDRLVQPSPGRRVGWGLSARSRPP
ncbi:hypothetical protein GCM10018785_05260 [Streptomyces longispororuber]|uniref:Uncharacterized protein n=1 Tax=Streptomyces longispororuber TaxID=68230 RepID=A0A918Z8N1_9ACTN|nr:hypothetical protein GCM10018785_05260 [Streptomyces longispororuber]